MPKKGYKQIEEHRRKRRKFTDEQEKEIEKHYREEKVSTIVLAKRWGCNEVTIRNVIIRNGYKLRTKSEARKGKLSWCKGLTKETDERVKKVSEKNKGKKAWNKNIKTGPCSDITKQRMSNAAILRVQNNPGPYKNTKPELKMKEILTSSNIPFEHQFRIKGINHIFDFCILNTNILIEVDGDYWHSNPKMFKKLNKIQKESKQRDERINNMAKNNNFILLRFWENDILNNKEKIVEKLRCLCHK